MIRVAITGNIASGKSSVQDALILKGYKVLDTDFLAHEILVQSQEIPKVFKQYDVFEDGKISRYKLGQLVFAKPELKKKLEEIIHPQIRIGIEKFFEHYSDRDIVFVGIPLLFEAKMEDLFDKIIFVFADDDIRLERLIKRNSYSVEHAKSRMDSQLSQEEKIKLSDYVIYNNEDIENLEEEILKLLGQIR